MDPTQINPGRTRLQAVAAEWTIVPLETGVPVAVEGPVSVGRSPDCTICIPDDFVSGNHARLFLEDGALFVEDLGSTNGTWVNGERVQRGALKHGDELRFDRFRYQVRRTSAAPAAPPAAPEAEAPGEGEWWRRSDKGVQGTVMGAFAPRDGRPAGVTQLLAGKVSGPTLVGASAPVRDRRVELRPGMMMIGRNPKCDVTIDEETVSDRHAQLVCEERGSVRIVNLPNTGGTLVNGARVPGGAYLNPGDVVSLGPRVDFVFLAPGGQPAPSERPQPQAGGDAKRVYLIAGIALIVCVLLFVSWVYVF